jgi:hypothetical protein
MFFSFQKWENALSDHVAYSTRMSNDMKVSDDEAEEVLPLGSLQESLQVTFKQPSLNLDLSLIYFRLHKLTKCF